MLLAICTVVGLVAGTNLVQHSRSPRLGVQTAASDTGRELNEIVRFIEEKYVDDVDSDALISEAIAALMKDLDPHSGYLSPGEVHELNEKMEGHFEGIGIEFHRVLDTAVILHVIPGGPADKAGLLNYDRIVSANDSMMTTPALTESDMVQFLRGERASVLELQIARSGYDSLITKEIERDVIPIHSVVGAYMINDHTGYVRITSFNARTYKEFMDHLEHLTQKEQMKDLIIDLRQNPGGYLKEAVNILSQLFKEKDKLLVYTEGEHASRTEYRTTGKPFYPVDNIAVLVDGGSASASEIVAGAIQDHDRGVIVGVPTFGKGLVQEQYSLSNGGALRLTIARYYTPSGRLIQKPYTNGVSVAENGQNISDTIVYYTSKGRSVTGSGGITPDIAADWDFDWHDPGMYMLYDNILEYALYAYHSTGNYASLSDLIENFPSVEIINADVSAYFSASPRTDDRFNRANLEANGSYARMLLMAMIATDQFGHEAWYQVMNTQDPVVQKALEVIKEDRKITLKVD